MVEHNISMLLKNEDQLKNTNFLTLKGLPFSNHINLTKTL